MAPTIAIAKKLVQSLNDKGIKCYIYHQSKYNSVYVKFEDERMRSVRIADHKGREKYKYKFNLRADVPRYKCTIDRGVKRHYYPENKWKVMRKHLINRYYKINGTTRKKALTER